MDVVERWRRNAPPARAPDAVARRAMPDAATERCDLIVTNGCVLTMDARRTIFSHGAVAVAGPHHRRGRAGGAIARPRWRAGSVIDAKGAIVHPGYIDAHLHINAQTCRGFFRGDSQQRAADGPNYADWKAALTGDEERRGRRSRRRGNAAPRHHGIRRAGQRIRAGRRRCRDARGWDALLRSPSPTSGIRPRSWTPFRVSQARPCLRACRRTAIAVSNCSAASCSATATRTAFCTATSRSMAKALRRTSFIAPPRRWQIAKA